VLYQDRAPKVVELSRQGWYAPGPQRRLLVRIIEHYKLDVIEGSDRKPLRDAAEAAGQSAARGDVLTGSNSSLHASGERHLRRRRDFYGCVQPHVERIEDLDSSLQCNSIILVALVARYLRFVHAQSLG
jgi:hypothetical protein